METVSAPVNADTDPAVVVSTLLRTAEEQALLGEQARTALRAQVAAGHADQAWMYEELAEACEAVVPLLVAEATGLYRKLDLPLQRRVADLACDCRFARCLC